MARRTRAPRRPNETAEAREARRAARRESVPPITYPDELPITARADELVAAIRAHPVVIVAGETGSGKSTQLPKMCLAAGRGIDGLIGHTQPRRVAARSVAERVASELGGELGGAVGYAVRFTDKVGPSSLVKVMTDGILLAEIRRDRRLSRYDTLIIDEAHERSLNIDFLLGYLRQLLDRRKDLKVIITSATIDTERLSAHFGGAPVVTVEGRTYPVEVRYRPIGGGSDEEHPDADDETDHGDRGDRGDRGVRGVRGDRGDRVDRHERSDDEPVDQISAVCAAVVELSREGPGDVLVFLSGEREIHDTAEALRALALRDTEILPLYARLSAAEQHRIFAAHPGRRIVLATNVAETSITVPGVRYVVDAGTARISRYSRRLKVQRLPIEPISQASARQRAGRCGRVAPGVCIRLYSPDDLARRPEYTEPEILRTNLASVILQMTAIGLGDVAAFPFVDPPDARSVKDGVLLLEELGAIESSADRTERRLTPIGRSLAQLPIDPRLGRMVLEADRLGCTREVLVIAAALSIQDPRERPREKAQAAEELHRRFVVPDSDFLAFVRLWDHLREQQKALSSSQFRKLCKREYLNYVRVREWQDLYSQLRQVASGLGIHLSNDEALPDHVHQALLPGLLSQIGVREPTTKEFQGARNARFLVGSGSALAKKPPRWVMAAELVETNRLWARVVGRIQPEWAERAAGHVVKRSYGEPRWDGRRAAAVASEKVTLYGLTLVADRAVALASVDAAAARDLFIWHALVEDDWRHHHEFVARNQALITRVRALEDRARRRNLLVGEEAFYEHFDQRLPASITSGRHFDAWWKRARQADPHLLDLTFADVVDPTSGVRSLDDFPDEWVDGPRRYRLEYLFDPSSPADGVTAHVPLEQLAGVGTAGFDWHVPGLRHEKVATLIRLLPKALRRRLVAANDHASAFLDHHGPADGPLLPTLAEALTEVAEAPVHPGDFDLEQLPAHLDVHVSIDDRDGRCLAIGPDLNTLRVQLRPLFAETLRSVAEPLERTGCTTWPVDPLPHVVEAAIAGHVVSGFPTLVDEGSTVGVRVATTEAEQATSMRAGTVRLLQLRLPSPRKALADRLDRDSKRTLTTTGRTTLGAVVADSVDGSLGQLVDDAGGVVWDAAAFAALAALIEPALPAMVVRTVKQAAALLRAGERVQRRIGELRAPSLGPAARDLQAQLDRLLPEHFVALAGVARLADVGRYLEAMERRMDKLADDVARDHQRMATVQRLEDEYQRAVSRLPRWRRDRDGGEVGWLLEELRVSLFAQQLGTATSVSEQRLIRELARLAEAR